jgi:hypothetical protein
MKIEIMPILASIRFIEKRSVRTILGQFFAHDPAQQFLQRTFQAASFP